MGRMRKKETKNMLKIHYHRLVDLHMLVKVLHVLQILLLIYFFYVLSWSVRCKERVIQHIFCTVGICIEH